MQCPASKLFGTDGVRGLVGRDLTPELVRKIGLAFGTVVARSHPGPVVLLGRDTRVSGPVLAEQITAGLNAAGVQVADCGIITTPGLCLLTRDHGRAGALMISASHNPPQFNGIKLVDASGEKLPDDTQDRIEQLILQDVVVTRRTSAPPRPSLHDASAGRTYLDLLVEHLSAKVSLTGLKVVLDCAWGAAWDLGPAALRRAGAQVIAVHAHPRGERINVGCGSLHPQTLAARVVAEKADLGVAFDGDADRAMFVDERGQVRDGDFAKYVLAADLQQQGLLNPPVVVGTVMSNPGLELALRELGVKLLRTPVGDRHVVAEMKRRGAVLGGEQSGHIVLSELGIGDGIYTALRICETVARAGKSLGELSAPVIKVPQILRNIPITVGYDWQTSTALAEAVEEWTARLGDGGYILIRPSGTEPLLRIMVAASDAVLTSEAVAGLVAVIEDETARPTSVSQHH